MFCFRPLFLRHIVESENGWVLVVDNSFDPAAKLVHIRWGKNNEIKPFNLAQVRRYNTPESTDFSFLNDINDRLWYFKTASIDFRATEVINQSDPRASDSRMNEAIKEEMKSLFERGTFKDILREEVPKDPYVLTVRFLLAIKSTEDVEIKYKVRFVMGGHRDKKTPDGF